MKREFHGRTPRSGGVLAIVGIGCLVIVVIVSGIGIYLAFNFRRLAADLSHRIIIELIDSAEIPEDQKIALRSRADRLTTDFKEGVVSYEQLGKIAERFGESSVFRLAILASVDENQLQSSGLTDEEKETAARSLQRFSRGILDQSISRDAITTAFETLDIDDFEDAADMREDLSDEELRELFDEFKKEADEAEVPDEPYQVDYAVEFGKMIDSVLGGDADDETTSIEPENESPGDEGGSGDEAEALAEPEPEAA